MKDNGDGLSEGSRGTRSGVGLANTRGRLRQLYGDRSRLTLSNAAGGGLEAILEMPWREAPLVGGAGGNMKQIKAFIADDEPLARDWLRTLLARGARRDAGRRGRETAARRSRRSRHARPDLLFLDVQMPELDGFDVLRALDAEALPVVVFVTAYDQHALKAFDVHALDYLLKPFERDRFRVAMERARESLAPRGGEAAARRLVALLESLGAKPGTLERVAVKTDGVIKLVRLADVDFIEAAGRYVTLHVGKEQHLLRETMNDLEAQLDAGRSSRACIARPS